MDLARRQCCTRHVGRKIWIKDDMLDCGQILAKREGGAEISRELIVGMFNVRAVTVDGNDGLSLAETMTEVCRQKKCDTRSVVVLQETRRYEHDGFTASDFTVYYNGAGIQVVRRPRFFTE